MALTSEKAKEMWQIRQKKELAAKLEAIDKQIAEKLALYKEGMAKVDYSSYVEYVHQGAYKHSRHTKLICEKLQLIHEGKLKRLAIFLPPRHSKSQTVTESFPSWYIGKDADRRVIQVSYGDDLAVDFGLKNRQKVEEYGKQLFGIELDADKQAKGDWGIKGKQGYMRSGGIMSPINGKGASLLILDDVVKNAEEAASDTIRERIWSEYQGSLLSRLTPNGAIILIMTRWHHDDIAGRILANEKDWEVINLPCEAEEGDLLGRVVGEPLWPEFGFNEAWIKDMKVRIGPRAWNALYQQRPTIEGGNLFKRSSFKFYTERPVDFEEEIHSWDMTFKDNKDSDFVVGTAWGIKDGRIYLLDRIKDRMDFTASTKAVEEFTKKWPNAGIKLIEDKANGPAIISALQFKIGGITPYTPKGSKYARAEAVTPLFADHRVVVPSTEIAPWVEDYINTLESFPMGKNDDDVDSTSQALVQYLYLLHNEAPPLSEVPLYNFDDDIDRQEGSTSWFD